MFILEENLQRGHFFMQKLKLIVLDKMIEKKCTNAEVDFILYISRFQNNQGIIKGVYYKEIAKELEISYQKFYDLKESLIAKDIIRVTKESYSDWNIKILDNDFTYPESYKEGYINTNHDIFYKREFFNMKAGEKLLAMQFMKISFSGRGSYNIGVNNFYEKYTKLFDVTKRVIQNYMTALKAFFSIGVKERQYWITPLSKVYRSNGATYNRAEVDTYNKHIGQVICRREKIEYTKQTLQDTVDLLKQYSKTLLDRAEEVLCNAVKKSIAKANESIRNKYKWKRVLQPKLVHKMLQEEIYDLCI